MIDQSLSPLEKIEARVELYNGSTLIDTIYSDTFIKSIAIERVGDESKFFGFGIAHKANIKLIDFDRAIDVESADRAIITFDNEYGEGGTLYPAFYITERNRNEKDSDISVTAYDKIGLMNNSEHTFSNLEIGAPYTILDLVSVCADYIGALSYSIIGDESPFNIELIEGVNFDGTETIREVLNTIAEVTNTIYYLDSNEILTFRALDVEGSADLTITKSDYFELETGDNKRLSAICAATELGDNISHSLSITGTTQFIRDNGIYTAFNGEEVAAMLSDSLARIGGLTINQFSCKWIGNFGLEIGDKIELICDDNSSVYSYLLNDVLTYDGAIGQETQWHYTNSEDETESAPATLGEALKHTFAKVDKVNRELTLVASETKDNADSLTSLRIDVESINSTVSTTKTELSGMIEAAEGNIETLATKISQLPDSIKAEVITEVQEAGADKVTTTTGFTFDANGLRISKDNTEISTQITENGMQIFRNEDGVLTANSEGVNAFNLHATTFLIIGENSRFEDYTKDGEARTACFFIGD